MTLVQIVRDIKWLFYAWIANILIIIISSFLLETQNGSSLSESFAFVRLVMPIVLMMVTGKVCFPFLKGSFVSFKNKSYKLAFANFLVLILVFAAGCIGILGSIFVAATTGEF